MRLNLYIVFWASGSRRSAAHSTRRHTHQRRFRSRWSIHRDRWGAAGISRLTAEGWVACLWVARRFQSSRAFV